MPHVTIDSDKINEVRQIKHDIPEVREAWDEDYRKQAAEQRRELVTKLMYS